MLNLPLYRDIVTLYQPGESTQLSSFMLVMSV
jgi:hypothetical protein